jgi:2-oxoglutarate dehydrogenase E2 component (dihydrolipoamide succinyltransferase)
MDEPVLEIATDKVDSEVPSEVDGKLVEILFQADDLVKVGQTIAIIETEGEDSGDAAVSSPSETVEGETETTQESVSKSDTSQVKAAAIEVEKQMSQVTEIVDYTDSDAFYSPLVKNIAKEENISLSELESIPGTGKDSRVTKHDILQYVQDKKAGKVIATSSTIKATAVPVAAPKQASTASPVSVNGGDEIIEMTRMGKLIAHHMVASVQTSAHVQSFIECDVTNIWNWRKKHKDGFKQREGENLTFTPIFIEAVAQALKEFPMMNIAIDGDRIIKRKNINIGMAAALPDGNLIVPVIKNADQLNLIGMAKSVNDLAQRSRTGKLKPDDTQGGTYTVTNVGTFGSVLGTPIINQPQVGILALGAIRKVPAVVETPDGDFIGIRMKMFLSHSYDHRVVNGALGGQFVQRVAHILEAFDVNRTV